MCASAHIRERKVSLEKNCRIYTTGQGPAVRWPPHTLLTILSWSGWSPLGFAASLCEECATTSLLTKLWFRKIMSRKRKDSQFRCINKSNNTENLPPAENFITSSLGRFSMQRNIIWQSEQIWANNLRLFLPAQCNFLKINRKQKVPDSQIREPSTFCIVFRLCQITSQAPPNRSLTRNRVEYHQYSRQTPSGNFAW